MASQKIKQPSIFGRIGSGIGHGLAEQIPKEIERSRLASGLQNFAKNSANLSPMEQLAQVSSIPGVTPQMVQSFAELAKQQAQGQALNRGVGGKKSNEESPSAKTFPRPPPSEKGETPPPKSITTTEGVNASINPYIPKTYSQILDRAGELFNENRDLYKSDPNNAIQAAVQEDAQNQAINTAEQNKRNTQQNVQSRVQSELKTQADNAGVQIPDNVYSDIEDRAISDVNSGKLTELEAGKKYKKELDAISRQYKEVETLGTGKLLTKSASANKESLRSLRKDFKKRDDLENFVEVMVAKNGLSYPKASYLGFHVSDNKDLNNTIHKLKDINENYGKEVLKKGYPSPPPTQEDVDIATLGAALKIGKHITPNDSILSIAEELKSKGYNPRIWMDYADKNRDKLHLDPRQVRELGRPRDFEPTWNDLWMFYFSGLDKLMEQ